MRVERKRARLFDGLGAAVTTLNLAGHGRGPWGTNVTYAWVEVDAEGNPVADADRAEGLTAPPVAGANP